MTILLTETLIVIGKVIFGLTFGAVSYFVLFQHDNNGDN